MKTFFLFLIVLSVISFSIFFIFFRDTYIYEYSIELFIFSLAMFLIWKNDWKTTLDSIGYPGNFWTTRKYFLAGMVALFVILLTLGIISFVLKFNDQSKVMTKVDSLPLFVLFAAVIIAPVVEEMLFRAALIPRIGSIPSALLFGTLHFGYGSVVEVIGAAAIGLLLSIIYIRSKSITPCILIHLFYNLLAVALMRFV